MRWASGATFVPLLLLAGVSVQVAGQLGTEGLQNPGAAPAVLYMHMGHNGNLAVNAHPPTRDWAAPANCTEPLADHVWWPVWLVGDRFDDLEDVVVPPGGDTPIFTKGGQARFHPPRQLVHDVRLEHATLHVAVAVPAGSPALPEVTLSVELLGGQVGDESTNLEENPLIAHGHSGQQTLLPSAAPQTLAFQVPLEMDSGNITRRDAATLRLTLRTGLPCGATPGLAILNEDGSRPRLDIIASPPVYLTYVHPEPVAGIVLIHVAAGSPWGRYDLDIANASVSIVGPSTPAALSFIVSQQSHLHIIQTREQEFTWMWRYRADNATLEGGQALPGDYTITITVQNAQHTATAIGTASLHIAPEGTYGVDARGRVVEGLSFEEEAPALPPLATVVLLAGTAAYWRRRPILP